MSETAEGAAPVQSSTPASEPTQGSEQAAPAPATFANQTPEPVADPSASTAHVAEPKAETPPAEVAKPEQDAAEVTQPDYTDIKLPESIKSDDPVLNAFLDSAQTHGVSRETAEALLESAAPGLVEALSRPVLEWQNTQRQWVDEIRADPEIGGANVRRVQTTIARLLDNPAFADPKFREAMDFTGAGNNPAFVRTFYRMAQALTESGPVAIGRPAAPPRDVAATLYPNQNQG